jgi:hypothetical protein
VLKIFTVMADDFLQAACAFGREFDLDGDPLFG